MRSSGLVIAFAGAGLARAAANVTDAAPSTSFDWSSIQPSSSLVYHPCYNKELLCARLSLPLDWHAANGTAAAGHANRTIALAVIKLPAVVPASDPAYAGPIVTNPGGPGGSGVEFVHNFGSRLRFLADKPGRRHYDIVAFDPRGVANSWPRADCFPGDQLARDAFTLETRAAGPLDPNAASLPYALSLYRRFGDRCRAAEQQAAEPIMAYMDTPSVASDMLALVDAMDELHRRQVGKPFRLDAAANATDSNSLPRLTYVGFSYGTVIGTYFAALFPGRVGRLVLDGIVDINDYRADAGWLKNTLDTERIVDTFFSGCHAAGPAACPLALPSDASARDVRKRYDALLANLTATPIALAHPTTGADLIITAGDVRDTLATALTVPLMTFRPIAGVIAALAAGDPAPMIATLDASGNAVLPSRDSCPAVGKGSAQPVGQVLEASNAVSCIDSDSVTSRDVSWWRKYLTRQITQSPTQGATYSIIRVACISWPFRPSWPFKGPFTTPASRRIAGKLDPAAPAAPVLFLSNRLDPLTPLASARAMVPNHPGARLVIQESFGHCALGAADSQCTRRIFADYLDSGVVPGKNETTCNDLPCGPWDEKCSLQGISIPSQPASLRKRFSFGLV